MLDKFEEIFKEIEKQSLKSLDARYLTRLKPLFLLMLAEINDLKSRVEKLEIELKVPLQVTAEPVKKKKLGNK